MNKFFFLLFILPFGLSAQCDLAINEIDPFDSTLVVSSNPMHIGGFIPSKFETIEGPKIIEEGEVLFSFAESDQGDSIKSFFLTIAAPEYNYEPIENGQNVLLALSDSSVIALHNFPDKGTFDKTINMRLYQHSCVVPVDTYYRLTYLKIKGIRIRYQNKKRTFFLTEKQQEALLQSIICVGEEVGFGIEP
jgi:hypothetical protein